MDKIPEELSLSLVQITHYFTKITNQYQQQIDALQTRCEQQSVEMARCQQTHLIEIDDCYANIKGLTQGNEQLASEIATLKRIYAQQQEQIKTLTLENTTFRQGDIKQKEQIKTITSEMTECQTQLTTITKQQEEINSQKQEQIKTLNTEIAKYQEHVKSLTNETTVQKQELFTQQEQNKAIITENTILKQDFDKYTTETASKQEQITSLIQEIKNHEEKLMLSEKELHALEGEIETLRIQNMSHVETINTLKLKVSAPKLVLKSVKKDAETTMPLVQKGENATQTEVSLKEEHSTQTEETYVQAPVPEPTPVIVPVPVPVTEPVAQPPQEETPRTQIKIKGIVYFLSKVPNDNGDFAIYDATGRQVGRKTREGKYIISRT